MLQLHRQRSDILHYKWWPPALLGVILTAHSSQSDKKVEGTPALLCWSGAAKQDKAATQPKHIGAA